MFRRHNSYKSMRITYRCVNKLCTRSVWGTTRRFAQEQAASTGWKETRFGWICPDHFAEVAAIADILVEKHRK